jgi:hypothetical protein
MVLAPSRDTVFRKVLVWQPIGFKNNLKRLELHAVSRPSAPATLQISSGIIYCLLEVYSICDDLMLLSRYVGTTETSALVLLSAHYDSRGTFGSTRAPGGNDDGSGVTHILAIARAIKENGIKFRSNVELVAFAGEEQGLIGSSSYASEFKTSNLLNQLG